jgi:hypothetical protein
MFEAYKIGVTLSLTNHVSKGLMLMAGDFAKTEAQVALLQKRINSIKNDALKGGLLLGAGAGMLMLFKGPLEEAKKFQTETAKFASLGFGDAVTAQAVKFARGMNTVGTSARDNLVLLSDAMAVFKNLDHAEFAAPIMAKMKFANEAVFGQKGGEHSTKFMDMLKVIEFRGGLSSEKEFSTQANFVQQVITGSRNRVDATQLLSALKTGGVALSRRSNDQFYLGAEPLIQEFGGQRYGTGAMSIYQNLVQSRGTITAQQELFRLGLLNPSMVQFNQLGKLKKALPGAFVGSGILESEGELSLLEKVLLPAFASKGINGEENIIRELGLILGNRTGSGLMARIYQQRSQIHTQSEANRGAENIDQLAARGGKTLAGKQIDLHAKFSTLMLALGDTVLPLAIKALEKLIPWVASLASWVDRNHTLVKGLATALIALAGGLALRGTVLLLSAAFRGLGLALLFKMAGGAGGIRRIGGAISGVASKFGTLATKIPGVTSALSTLLGILPAFGVAAGVGAGGLGATVFATGIVAGNKQAFKPVSENAMLSAMSGDTGFAAAIMNASDGFVKPGSAKPIQITTQVDMDGFRVASLITRHQSAAASKPQLGTGRFDPGLMPISPGMSLR